MTKVLVVVFDGLQPAQVTGKLMPNLAEFAESGVTFANHHAVYPSVTRANASSMVTGLGPGGHGISANTLMVPDYDPNQAIPALEPQLEQVARTTGRVLLAPTLAEALSRHGQEYVAIGVGTSGNAYLHNPNAQVAGAPPSTRNLPFPGPCTRTLPPGSGPGRMKLVPTRPGWLTRYAF